MSVDSKQLSNMVLQSDVPHFMIMAFMWLILISGFMVFEVLVAVITIEDAKFVFFAAVRSSLAGTVTVKPW